MKIKNLKIAILTLLLISIILSISVVYVVREKNQNDEYSVYKKYPGDSETPGGPDYYESVCLKRDSYNPSDKFLSKNRDDYYFIEGNSKTLNNQWKRLFSQITSINDKLNLDIIEFIYDETGGNGIFIIKDSTWNKLSDDEKLDFLQESTSIITKTVFEQPDNIVYASLFYTCKNNSDKKWIGAATNRRGELEISFDWKK